VARLRVTLMLGNERVGGSDCPAMPFDYHLSS
jgi:hypothetical protein